MRRGATQKDYTRVVNNNSNNVQSKQAQSQLWPWHHENISFSEWFYRDIRSRKRIHRNPNEAAHQTNELNLTSNNINNSLPTANRVYNAPPPPLQPPPPPPPLTANAKSKELKLLTQDLNLFENLSVTKITNYKLNLKGPKKARIIKQPADIPVNKPDYNTARKSTAQPSVLSSDIDKPKDHPSAPIEDNSSNQSGPSTSKLPKNTKRLCSSTKESTTSLKSTKEKLTTPSLKMILEPRVTVIDRRPMLRKRLIDQELKKLKERKIREGQTIFCDVLDESLISLDEDCDGLNIQVEMLEIDCDK